MKIHHQILVLVFFFCSCKTYQKVAGKYKLNAKDVYTTLELNKDSTFVQYVSTDLCSGKFYYGTYELKKGNITLKPLDATVNIINKKDVVVYSFDSSLKTKEIYIVQNEMQEAVEAEVSVNDSIHGVADSNGMLRLKIDGAIKSVLIKSFSFSPRFFKIDTAKNFNRLFIMVYDFALTKRCTDFYFQKKFSVINNNKLKITSKSCRKEAPAFYMLRQY
ncbi:MAG: hypothetical protein K2X48_16310 [Chitinophagaceae bacterium]|nr:hypothetical protein [Chitinophagaceae bacterium]